jgi:hypothetical protein
MRYYFLHVIFITTLKLCKLIDLLFRHVKKENYRINTILSLPNSCFNDLQGAFSYLVQNKTCLKVVLQMFSNEMSKTWMSTIDQQENF